MSSEPAAPQTSSLDKAAESGVSLRQFLDGLGRELDARMLAAQQTLEHCREDADAIKGLRIAVQRKTEDLERTYNGIANNVAKVTEEYERLARLADRASNALALVPPESPQAPKRAIRAIKDVPRLRQELAKCSTAIQTEEPICGIYFLLQDADVVYVGQSINIISRVATHVTDGTKAFNRWCYVKLQRHELNDVERFYITLLRPKFNVTHKPVLTTAGAPIFAAEAPC